MANDLEVRLPGNLQMDDTDVAAAIARALKWSVNVPQGITATVQQGWVKLDGAVEWSFQRDAAEQAIRDLIGVKGVTNLIRIKAHPATVDVRQEIEKAFHRSAQIDADHVIVSVTDDTITLTGSVRSWAEHDEAEGAARTAGGAREVLNQLHVVNFALV